MLSLLLPDKAASELEMKNGRLLLCVMRLVWLSVWLVGGLGPGSRRPRLTVDLLSFDPTLPRKFKPLPPPLLRFRRRIRRAMTRRRATAAMPPKTPPTTFFVSTASSELDVETAGLVSPSPTVAVEPESPKPAPAAKSTVLVLSIVVV